MADIKKSGYMKYKDKAGNMYLMMPITNTDNVEGLDDQIKEAKTLDTPVAATSTDGVAYAVTVPGITALTAGYSFIMIPDKISSSISTTLNVNDLGAKALRVRVSGYSGTTSSPMTTNWLAPNKPVRVTYDGMWWIAEVVLPSAQQLYGDVKAEAVTYTNTSSGLSATQVQAAIDELAGGALKTQTLTTAEYEALTDKNENTFYMLSDAEEDSAGIFWATYGTTTLSEIKAEHDAGKLVMLAYNNDVYQMTRLMSPLCVWFSAIIPNTSNFAGIAKGITLLNGTWSEVVEQRFDPTPHASTHASDGDDPITPADIGAATMTEVNTAIETAIGSAIGGDY